MLILKITIFKYEIIYYKKDILICLIMDVFLIKINIYISKNVFNK